MTKKYILAIDEGTASARAALFDIASKNLVSLAAIGITQHYPKEGWVEHDANQIWQAESEAIRACLKKVDATADEIVGMGMANQRESVLAWNKRTGEPISPVIVWQCRRTAKRCQDLAKTQKKAIKAKTGLIADSYFSATKMEWLLNNNKEVKKLAKSGDLCLGTIDSFLCFKLTGKFVTDVTNASRTMLFNIKKLEWDEELLKMFKIPASALAKVVNCDEIVGETTLFGGGKIAVAGIMGDQQAALFGQCCTSKGMVKSTYGTGCFMLMNIGESFEACPKNILTTIAFCTKDKINYAFEGSIFNAGSIVTWLKDELGFFEKSSDTDAMARAVDDCGGVYLVPAFTGLGAPNWDSDARAMLVGMTRATNKNHLVRAGLTSIAFCTKQLLEEMKKGGYEIKEIRCDGGVSKNQFLMQFQSDLLETDLRLPKNSESTVMGVVYMCGLAFGVFKSLKQISSFWEEKAKFVPQKNLKAKKEYKKWKKAVKLCMLWR